MSLATPTSSSSTERGAQRLRPTDYPRTGRVIGLLDDRVTGVAALVAGGLSVVIGVLQFLYPQDADAAMDVRTRVILAMFAVSLWAFAAVFLGLARYARSSWGAALAACGTTLLTVGTVSSAVNGADLAIFPFIALPANLMWFVGAIALSVSLVRARRVSVWLALPLPLIQIPLLILSQRGGGVIAGSFVLVVGAILLAGRIVSRRRSLR